MTASPRSAMSFPLVGALDVPGGAAACHGGSDLPRAKRLITKGRHSGARPERVFYLVTNGRTG